MNDVPIQLFWLGKQSPTETTGVTWGVPWERGALDRNESLALFTGNGSLIPLQTWNLAYWPDSSVKWTAHATVVEEKSSDTFELRKGPAVAPEYPLTCQETDDEIAIDTGAMTCRIAKHGASIITAIQRDGRDICCQGTLVCIREERSEKDGRRIRYEEDFESRITSATLEQDGPVRAVVKIEGTHTSLIGDREWLPFTLRLYFYAGLASLRIVHSFIFDDDHYTDFIAVLGMRFTVPLSETLHNRHVRFSGEGRGLWAEPVQLLPEWNGTFMHRCAEMYQDQLAGRRVPDTATIDAQFHETDKDFAPQHKFRRVVVEDSAVWDSFKLVQDSADHFWIQKRTNNQSCWVEAAHGGRSSGLAYVGDSSGGLAAGLRNFWQSHPSALHIEGAAGEQANLTLWFWSPDSPPMDLRHYDIKGHPKSYEDSNPAVESTPYGVARTSELTLWALPETPSHEHLLRLSQQLVEPPLLVCAPEHYHNARVFGVWSLPDTGTPAKAWLETELDSAIDFYKNEVEQRHWYGFWHYGDVMHSYDRFRHAWRYDVGGYAWDNNELVPQMWLWYAFLRSGRADIFRMAEAMTRHTSEVDVHHIGPYARLGSRHNVVHWGCAAKEARISMAGLKRFYYYLTADERTGDLMREVADADFQLVTVDPMRRIMEPCEYPTHARSGPDWVSFCSNWLAEWERFENTAYRDKIITGMRCLVKMPFKLFSGTTFGYDPETGILSYIGDHNYQHHMVSIFGGAEIWLELLDLIDEPEWTEALADFGEIYGLDDEEKVARLAPEFAGTQWGRGEAVARLTAFAAARRNDTAAIERIWHRFLHTETAQQFHVTRPMTPQITEALHTIRPFSEVPWISTNHIAQWCLNAIECLELIGDHIPGNVFADILEA